MNTYHLNKTNEGWVLKKQGDPTGQTLAGTKDDAIRAAASYLKGETGSLRIHHLDGTFDEERTFPRSADPLKSPG